MNDIAALILAGGLARRMGGGDKALLLVGGHTILARTLATLAPHAAATALSANDDPARFAPYGLPVLPDTMEENPGPLAGVLAGMAWAAGLGLPWLLTVPGDCPLLPPDLLPRLHAARTASGIAVASSGGRTHNTTALWPTALHGPLHTALLAGNRKVGGFQAAHGTIEIDWPDTPFDPFLNVNTPADLVAANGLAASPPSATASATAGPRTPPPG